MLSNKKIVPHSGDPSSGYAAFRMTCWGDTFLFYYSFLSSGIFSFIQL